LRSCIAKSGLLKTVVWGGGSDQVNDGFIADEWPAPVLRYEREEAMSDLVPFADARSQMTDHASDTKFPTAWHSARELAFHCLRGLP